MHISPYISLPITLSNILLLCPNIVAKEDAGQQKTTGWQKGFLHIFSFRTQNSSDEREKDFFYALSLISGQEAIQNPVLFLGGGELWTLALTTLKTATVHRVNHSHSSSAPVSV